MKPVYSCEPDLSVEEFVSILQRSTLAERRPVDEPETLRSMLRNATLIVTARTHESEGKGELIGVARAISDHAYCTYLSDLAVDRTYQGQGIGRELIRRTHQEAGPKTTLILLSAPKAQSFYSHIGLHPHPSCWTVPGSKTGKGSLPNTAPRSQPSSSSKSNQSQELAGFFDEISNTYAEAIQRCVPRYGEMLGALFEYLPAEAQKPKRVLELGCGTGNLSQLLTSKFPEAEFTFVDISEQSVSACRQRLPIETKKQFLVEDFRQLHFEDESFELITSSISLHHLTSPEKRELFRRCFDWLTPGGILTYCDQFSAEAEDIYQRNMQRWKSYTESAGASEEEWKMWMQHQQDHDFHDTLPEQMAWMNDAGFQQVDCPWRYLLWTVLQGRKP